MTMCTVDIHTQVYDCASQIVFILVHISTGRCSDIQAHSVMTRNTSIKFEGC